MGSVVYRRSGAVRAVIAALGALAAFAVQPGMAARAGIDPGPGSGCPASTGVPGVVGSVITFQGSISCYVPGATRPFGNAINKPSTTESVPAGTPPTPGQPCQQFFNYPVRFIGGTTDPGQNGPVEMQFQHFGGGFTGTLPFGDAVKSGTQDAYVTDIQVGSYEPSNAADPNSALTCQTDQRFHSSCNGQLDVPECPTFVDQANAVDGNPPPPVPLFDAARGSIQGAAGTVVSSPVTTAVVNTPTCFWVTGMAITTERDLQLFVAGPADASGRQIFYDYVAVIKFGTLQWHFDDGSNSEVQLPAACNAPQPQVPEQSTAHVYQQISDGHNGDDTYHVWATEFYSVTATVSWWDESGSHTQQPVPLSSDLQTLLDQGVQTPVYDLRVGQVEGVPVGAP